MGEYYNDAHKYDDIIDLPHHQSAQRPHMSLHDRAAQFAPFAALTGHEEAIEETARLTDEKIILDDNALDRINEKFAYIAAHLQQHPVVSVTYFRPDTHKSGGAYLTDIGAVKKLEEEEKQLVLENGVKIPLAEIIAIEVRKS